MAIKKLKRIGVFETNSSSAHSLVIPNYQLKTEVKEEKTETLNLNMYGFEIDDSKVYTIEDKLLLVLNNFIVEQGHTEWGKENKENLKKFLLMLQLKKPELKNLKIRTFKETKWEETEEKIDNEFNFDFTKNHYLFDEIDEETINFIVQDYLQNPNNENETEEQVKEKISQILSNQYCPNGSVIQNFVSYTYKKYITDNAMFYSEERIDRLERFLSTYVIPKIGYSGLVDFIFNKDATLYLETTENVETFWGLSGNKHWKEIASKYKKENEDVYDFTKRAEKANYDNVKILSDV